MTVIKAKPDDNLNMVFNTQGRDALCVFLPDNVTYHQKVRISRSNLIIIGGENSIISHDDHNGMVPGFGTADSATLTISGSNVKVLNLDVENSFDYPYYKSIREPGDGMGLQAVAVYIAPGADDVVFSGCSFHSWQDTLFADGVNNSFIRCRITGCVDFIFGSARACFNDCTIVSNGEGYVAAPSTKADNECGFSFVSCDFTCENSVREQSVYLARPWHPGGRPGVNCAMSVYKCITGKHINHDLWTWMKDSKGIVHQPSENRFFMLG